MDASAPVLLWGPQADAAIAAVSGAIVRRRAPYFFIDQTRIRETELTWSFDGSCAGSITVAGCQCDLARVRAAYLRPYPSEDISITAESAPMSPETEHAVAVDDALNAFFEVTPALVINRTSTQASNGSKPFQAEIIRTAGFAVPDTLVTTDLRELEHFRAHHPSVVYKSISAVRSIVGRLGPEHEPRLADLIHCPTQFQAYVPGRDFRVHVVQDRVFVHAIMSDAIDYRYAAARGESIDIVTGEVPRDIADRAVALTCRLGLVLAGLDLRRTPDGEWFCFEVNPSPGFVYYERDEDEPIADAVADALIGARAQPR